MAACTHRSCRAPVLQAVARAGSFAATMLMPIKVPPPGCSLSSCPCSVRDPFLSASIVTTRAAHCSATEPDTAPGALWMLSDSQFHQGEGSGCRCVDGRRALPGTKVQVRGRCWPIGGVPPPLQPAPRPWLYFSSWSPEQTAAPDPRARRRRSSSQALQTPGPLSGSPMGRLRNSRWKRRFLSNLLRARGGCENKRSICCSFDSEEAEVNTLASSRAAHVCRSRTRLLARGVCLSCGGGRRPSCARLLFTERGPSRISSQTWHFLRIAALGSSPSSSELRLQPQSELHREKRQNAKPNTAGEKDFRAPEADGERELPLVAVVEEAAVCG